jgi:phosphoribosylanthranilate isomerase
MFLFDSAGEKYGGTGKMFDHRILSGYALDTRYILSGGISSADSSYLNSMNSDRMVAVDLNSRFEIKPGIKDINLLKNFIEKLRKHDTKD